jgi:hypothetical protein
MANVFILLYQSGLEPKKSLPGYNASGAYASYTTRISPNTMFYGSACKNLPRSFLYPVSSVAVPPQRIISPASVSILQLLILGKG